MTVNDIVMYLYVISMRLFILAEIIQYNNKLFWRFLRIIKQIMYFI